MALTVNLALLGYAGYAQAGTWSASSEQTAYPAINLGGLDLWTRVWRGAEGALAAVQVKILLPAPVTAQGLILVGTNLAADATRAVVFSPNADLSAPIVSIAQSAAFDNSVPGLVDDTPPWGRPLIYLHPTPLTFLSAAFTLWDPHNADGFLRACIGLAEPIWQPFRNYDVSAERENTMRGDPGVQQTIRNRNFPLKVLTEAEERQLTSLARKLQNTGRLFVIPEPTRPSSWCQDAFWGVFTGTLKANAVDKRGKFRTTGIAFEEVDE